MNKRILVTGGLGFIGCQTIKPLLEAGYEVHVITSRQEAVSNSNFVIHQADLLDCSVHTHLMINLKPSYLLHAAWYTQNSKFWSAVENAYWLSATISLARAFYSNGGQRLLALGTCAEYDWSSGLCVEECTPELSSSIYGQYKKLTADALKLLAKHHHKSLVWARVFFPYGPGEAPERLIPYVIQSLLRNEEAKCTHGAQVRDFIYVEDLGQALVTLLGSSLEGVVNVGTGVSVSIRELVYQIGDLLDKRDKLIFGAIPEPEYSPPALVASPKRLNADTGWSPQFSLKEGLQRTIEWWRSKIKPA